VILFSRSKTSHRGSLPRRAISEKLSTSSGLRIRDLVSQVLISARIALPPSGSSHQLVIESLLDHSYPTLAFAWAWRMPAIRRERFHGLDLTVLELPNY